MLAKPAHQVLVGLARCTAQGGWLRGYGADSFRSMRSSLPVFGVRRVKAFSEPEHFIRFREEGPLPSDVGRISCARLANRYRLVS